MVSVRPVELDLGRGLFPRHPRERVSHAAADAFIGMTPQLNSDRLSNPLGSSHTLVLGPPQILISELFNIGPTAVGRGRRVARTGRRARLVQTRPPRRASYPQPQGGSVPTQPQPLFPGSAARTEALRQLRSHGLRA